jgi:hydroxymethylpyrimidine pyrophosphatase-like HAD family hydrolase
MYVDLDGTLLGPGGSLLCGADGSFALDGVRALQACERAGVEVVIYSGRMYSSVFDGARLLGLHSFIFEIGCGLVLDGELEWLTGGLQPSRQKGTIYEQIEATGAPALLLQRFAGSLEYHTPWSVGREVSHLFRGLVPSSEAQAVLAQAGLDWLRLVDNGVIWTGDPSRDGHERRDGPRWGVGPGRVHAYHLIPAVASKARAVARHMQNRGYAPMDCIAVGDSREDMDAAGIVGCFWLVANALQRDPTLAREIAGRPGVRVASEGFGAGVYEAVLTTLAGG